MAYYDGTNAPTLQVQADLGKQGTFILDTSPLDGTDVLIATGSDIPVDWTDLPVTSLRQLSIRRGRTREDQVVQPGVLTVTFDDWSGDFDPDNTASPYAWNGQTMLTRGLKLRVLATWDAVVYPLYYGRLEIVDADMSLDPTVTLTAVDDLAWLAKIELRGLIAPNKSGKAYDVFDYYFNNYLPGYRGFNNVPTYTTPALANCRSVQNAGSVGINLLEKLNHWSTAEFGSLFMSRDNVVTLRQYEDRYTQPFNIILSDSRANGTIEYDEIVSSPGSKYLTNMVVNTDVDGVEYTSNVLDSQARYGVYEKGSDVYLNLPAEAQEIADLMAAYYATPATRVESVSFEAVGIGTEWPDLLATELGNNVSVERTTVDGRARLFPSLIESLNHDITPNSWRVTMELSPSKPALDNLFTLNSSLLDGSDVLWY